MQMSCKSGADSVGFGLLSLKTSLRVCAVAFSRCLMVNLPYWCLWLCCRDLCLDTFH